MSKVVTLDVVTTLDIPVSRVLDGAQDLEQCLVIGWTEDGELHFAASQAAGPENLWLLELAKAALLEIGKGED